MGRKSLKAEGVTKILDSFEKCIENKGLRGTTIGVIAKQAGMDRRMILHYIGKREDLIRALVERIILRYTNSAFEFSQQEINAPLDEVFLNYYFGHSFRSHPSTRLVTALITEVAQSESIRIAVKSIYDSFLQGVVSILRVIAPNAEPDEINATAFMIMSLSSSSGWMAGIGFDEKSNVQNRLLAERLINELMNS